jgi:hypothetical protein
MKRKNVNFLLIILMLIVSSFIFIITFETVKADPSDPWFDTDWDYRKEITVTNKIEGYQTLLNISYDTTNIANVSSNSNTNFSDLRFTAENGSLIPYWIEYTDEGNYSIVWVNNKWNETKLYMYYGNTEAECNSNGTDTWDFFDDFSNTTWSDRWKDSTFGTVSIVDGWFRLKTSWTSGGGKTDSIYTVRDDIPVGRTVFKLRVTNKGTNIFNSPFSVYKWVDIPNYFKFGHRDNNADNSNYRVLLKNEGVDTGGQHTTGSIATNQIFLSELCLDENYQRARLFTDYINGTEFGSTVSFTETLTNLMNDSQLRIIMRSFQNTVEIEYDFIYSGKYNETEPSFTFGEETGEAPPITVSSEYPASGAVNVTFESLPYLPDAYYTAWDEYEENLTQKSLNLWDDGLFDERDITPVIRNYGISYVPPPYRDYDLNNDGEVDITDVSVLTEYSGIITEPGILLTINTTHLDDVYDLDPWVLDLEERSINFQSNASGEWIDIGYNNIGGSDFNSFYEESGYLPNTIARCHWFLEDFDFKWGETYYWRVSVNDTKGNCTVSEIYNFTTISPILNVTSHSPLNNSHLTPDPMPEYFEVNISSDFSISATVYFFTNISGDWVEFDNVTKELTEDDGNYTENFRSINTTWCSFDENNYWKVVVTAAYQGYDAEGSINRTYNFTTDRCYQIFSYDDVYNTEPVYSYIRMGDIRSQSAIKRMDDAYLINTEQGVTKTIKILYNGRIPVGTVIENFKLRAKVQMEYWVPANTFKLYINGVDYGYADRWVNFKSTPEAQPESNPPTRGDAFPYWRATISQLKNPYKYLEWDINFTVTELAPILFEIYKPSTKGPPWDEYLILPPRTDQRSYRWTTGGDIWYSIDEAVPAMDDHLTQNFKRTNVAPNGIWEGYGPKLTPDPVFEAFKLYTFRSIIGATPFNWNEFTSEYIDYGCLIYEFTYKRTDIYGERILPDTYPKNNSIFVEANPDLECHIRTNNMNFTIDNSPVFVSVQTNYTGDWVEIWNNTGNYSESASNSGTFRINSSQYNFSFDQANTLYYWRVCSRKLSPGAEWTNRTFSFTIQTIIANFTYFKETENSIRFTDTSLGSIDYYVWDFGDGRYSFDKNPSHYYSFYENYTVTLSIENEETGFVSSYTLIITAGTPTETPETPILVTIGNNFYWLIPIISLLIALAIIKIVMDQIKRLGDQK